VSTEHGAALPPSADELAAMESDRIGWAALLGAKIEEAPELGGLLVTHSAPTSTLNYVARVRWSAADFERSLEHVVSEMSDRGLWPSLVVCEGLTEPPDVADRLRAAGWISVFSDRMMYTRHPAVVPHLDPTLRVEAVTPASALEAIRIETQVFGLMPQEIGEQAELLADSVAAGTSRGFLLRLGPDVVATARLVPGPVVAGLHAIGVDARQRRRGYGRMLTAIATRAGLATGHKLVWLSVLEENTAAVEMYRSLGFEFSFRWSRWVAPA
jgi:ribosomal protein S18 acetylase RimI-like enzyme